MNAWSAILPLFGVVVGAALQYWLSRSAEYRKQLHLSQSQSYVDYLQAVTKAAHSKSPEAAQSAQADAADAKARMAVYGTSRVISALVRFEETGAWLNNPRAYASFVTLVSAMRHGEGEAQPDDLRLALFGAPKDKV